jgi:hypothetical protein
METERTSQENREETLRLMEMRREVQQYSYDLTQRLTFFVISIELIFCGYILLNSEKLGVIKFSSILFLLSGAAAIFGLFWRFCYNQTFHENAHGKWSRFYKIYNRTQTITYWIYIILTITFFLGVIGTGYNYIRGIEKGIITSEATSQNCCGQISEGLDNAQKGLDNIANSIEKLSKIEPKVIVKMQPPLNESKMGKNK